MHLKEIFKNLGKNSTLLKQKTLEIEDFKQNTSKHWKLKKLKNNCAR